MDPYRNRSQEDCNHSVAIITPAQVLSSITAPRKRFPPKRSGRQDDYRSRSGCSPA